MSFLDAFKGSQYKKELETLQKKYADLEKMLTPEMRETVNLKDTVNDLNRQIGALQQEITKLDREIDSKKTGINELENKIRQKEHELESVCDDILAEPYGLYRPTFPLCSALGYKEKLDHIREKEKSLIKSNKAVTGAANWTVDNSRKKGQKMISDMQKLLLRAFNLECDDLVAKVKYSNYESSANRIRKSADSISKLGKTMEIAITNEYVKVKIAELTLAHKYAQAIQDEKEALREAREKEREQAKAQKELEEKLKAYEKEREHYRRAYEEIQKRLQDDPGNKDLQEKHEQLKDDLEDVEKAITDVNYRKANTKVGTVYIISNIGSFGEGVYKIGMTRRPDPQERIDELGSASVPFGFDVHAKIYTDDAPGLEAALHKAFEDRKVNLVNTRKEFFRVSLEEIKKAVMENYDKTVIFTDYPAAEQYRMSERMRHETTES